jgi:hypothetical protein
MAVPELAVDTVSIVMRGVFDPSKLSSKELVAQNLFSSDDLCKATQKFSNNDTSILDTEAIRFLANKELIQLTALDADEFAPLRDLAVNILRWLNEAKIGALGINRDSHFAVESKREWHAVGDSISPKNIWDGVLDDVGLASVTLQALRANLFAGYQQITIQASNLISQGIFVSRNDHYTLELLKEPPSSRDEISLISRLPLNPSRSKVSVAIRVLNNEWPNSIERSEAVIQRVARQAKA